jgi:hypothetical protein
MLDFRRDLVTTLTRRTDELASRPQDFQAWLRSRLSPYGWKIQLLEAADFARRHDALTPEHEGLIAEHLAAIAVLEEGLAEAARGAA